MAEGRYEGATMLLDKTTLELCPTGRDGLMCTITDPEHEHVFSHMVDRPAPTDPPSETLCHEVSPHNGKLCHIEAGHTGRHMTDGSLGWYQPRKADPPSGEDAGMVEAAVKREDVLQDALRSYAERHRVTKLHNEIAKALRYGFRAAWDAADCLKRIEGEG